MKLFLLSLMLLQCLTSFPQISGKLGSEVETFINEREKVYPLNGALLISKGNTKMERFYGLANVTNSIKVDSNTRFNLASCTKPFTATAILLLQQEKKLSINDKLTKWIQGAPATWKGLTIKHLLTHTSGIQEISQLMVGKSIKGLASVLVLYKSKTLSFLPGEKFEYSNTNYILLSYIIEKASGTSYELFVKNRIFQPIKMQNSGFSYIDGSKNIALPYHDAFLLKQVPKSDLADLSILKGAGGMFSTAKDLQLFLSGLTKLLFPNTIEQMVQIEKEDYGLGWHILKENNKTILKHSGSINGFTSEMRYILEDSTAIILLSNVTSNSLPNRYTAFSIYRILNGETLVYPDISQFLGSYTLSNEFRDKFSVDSMQVIQKEGALELHISGKKQEIKRLIPMNWNQFFFYGEGAVSIRFDKDGKGAVLIVPRFGEIKMFKQRK
ncbi:MAG TPA: serine hydrolase domain-containing protein [Chitinophagaceae bacterium]|nr:serine hydrolase domain-containing protein [Chitinophagaceae bacterium]